MNLTSFSFPQVMAKKQIEPNLYILTTTKGQKYYLARFNRGGKQIERSLGNVNSISLREARLQLFRVMDSYEEETAKKRKVVTFAVAFPQAMDTIAQVKMWKGDGSRRQWEQTIKDYALPIIGDIPIDEINRQHILSVLKPIWFDKTETASRLRMRLEAIIGWAIRNDLRGADNPAVWRGCLEYDLPGRGKVQTVKHHDAMTPEEARIVVKYCLSHPSPVSAAILFGIATAGRVQEFRFARRCEIEGNVWLVPSERRKDKKAFPHRVPLSTLAKKALDMGEGDDYVFTYKGKLICADSPRLKLRAILNKPVTMHGCRSTFRDWCAENGIDRVLAEKSLMHATGNEVEQAYQRADLLEQRRPIIEQWSDYLLAE